MIVPGSKVALSSELNDLLESIRQLRGPNENWIPMKTAVSKYITECKPHERVWCLGEVHAPHRHYPAALVYNTETKTVVAVAASGEDFGIEEHSIHLFHSNIPHIAIARSVYTYPNEDATVCVKES